jgi:hypothetical protein
MSTVIVKIQTALSDPTHPSLVYDRDRTFMFHVPEAQVAERMRGRPKVYFYAEVIDDKLALGDEAPDQPW